MTLQIYTVAVKSLHSVITDITVIDKIGFEFFPRTVLVLFYDCKTHTFNRKNTDAQVYLFSIYYLFIYFGSLA